MGKTLAIEFKAFGFFTVALGLRVRPSLVAADGELVFSIIAIIICAIEGEEDLVEDLFGGEGAGFG